jgi:hypothetical protein
MRKMFFKEISTQKKLEEPGTGESILIIMVFKYETWWSAFV